MAHYHLVDSGDALLDTYPTRKEAIASRRRVYADSKTFVDTRDMLPISQEFPIIKCESDSECIYEEEG